VSKKTQRKKRSGRNQPPQRRVSWTWLAVGGVVAALAAAGLLLLLASDSDGEAAADIQVGGTPRLAVDRTTIDEGYIQFDVPVRTTFRLSNVGDAPLKISGQPQVKLVQGC
jgi:hypothetical protein